MTEQRRLLLISEDPTFRYHAANAFASQGCDVWVLESASEPLAPDRVANIDGLVLEASVDARFSVVSVIDDIRGRWSALELPVVVCMADEKMLRAHRMYLALRGCSALGRPFAPSEVLHALDNTRTLDLADTLPSRSPVWS